MTNQASLDPKENLGRLTKAKPLNLVETTLKQGMSPDEISEIVSERIIEVVKTQFEQAKKKYREALTHG